MYFTGGAAVALTIVCAPFVSPALRRICLPYVPATTSQIENVFVALKNRQGKLVDLGSGDGRIVSRIEYYFYFKAVAWGCAKVLNTGDVLKCSTLGVC